MKSTVQYGKRTDRALDMWVKLARAFASFNHLAVEQIRSYGLTQAQFGVLECLGHKGRMTIGDLCRKQLVSGGNMTVVVDNLEKENLVARVRSASDRRTVHVQLTPRGQKLFDQTFPQHAEFITALASLLTESEQESLAHLLKKLGLELQAYSHSKRQHSL